MEKNVSLKAVRFGPFEADLRAGELRKHGVKLKLVGQPFEVLANAAGVSRPVSNARGITHKAVANGYVCGLRPWPQCCGEQTQGRAERIGRKANICRDLASARLPFHQRSGVAGLAGPEATSH